MSQSFVVVLEDGPPLREPHPESGKSRWGGLKFYSITKGEEKRKDEQKKSFKHVYLLTKIVKALGLEFGLQHQSFVDGD